MHPWFWHLGDGMELLERAEERLRSVVVQQLESAVIEGQFGGWTFSDEGRVAASGAVHLGQAVGVVRRACYVLVKSIL
jgi:hypothetical protein